MDRQNYDLQDRASIAALHGKNCVCIHYRNFHLTIYVYYTITLGQSTEIVKEI